MERRFFRASDLSDLTTPGRTFLIVSVAMFPHAASVMLARSVTPEQACPTDNRYSLYDRNEVPGNKRDERRGGDYHVPVEGQCGGETPVEESRQRAGAATGGAGCEVKEMSPQTEIWPLRESLRRHEHECPQCPYQNGPARYSFGENGHGLDRK